MIVQGIYEIQIQQAIRNVQAGREGRLDMSKRNEHRLPHHVLAQLFNTYAYQDQGTVEKPVKISILYNRQEKTGITLCCLKRQKHAEYFSHIPPLRMSLISMRHLAIDYVVDRAWFRNKEIPQDGGYRKKVDYCYRLTEEQLPLLFAKGTTHIELYHTGFHAAVIGFYSALIEFLYRKQQTNPSSPSVQITPYYFDRSVQRYWKGRVWN